MLYFIRITECERIVRGAGIIYVKVCAARLDMRTLAVSPFETIACDFDENGSPHLQLL